MRFDTDLDHDEIVSVMNERAPGFRALDGLEQKYYLRNPDTRQYGGLYLWESYDNIVAYRETDLAATIASAYQTVGVPDVQVFEIISAVRD